MKSSSVRRPGSWEGTNNTTYEGTNNTNPWGRDHRPNPTAVYPIPLVIMKNDRIRLIDFNAAVLHPVASPAVDRPQLSGCPLKFTTTYPNGVLISCTWTMF